MFLLKKKVYYHHTDTVGVVYYGRYLEFLEDARTEFFYSKNIDVGLHSEEGTQFVIISVEIKYKRPAKYLDEIDISAEVENFTASTIHFKQKVFKGETLLVEADVVLACVGKDFKPKRLPLSVKENLC
jgi:acyl-CoA thioester hydrolase